VNGTVVGMSNGALDMGRTMGPMGGLGMGMNMGMGYGMGGMGMGGMGMGYAGLENGFLKSGLLALESTNFMINSLSQMTRNMEANA
jgi:hypothetical protein